MGLNTRATVFKSNFDWIGPQVCHPLSGFWFWVISGNFLEHSDTVCYHIIWYKKFRNLWRNYLEFGNRKKHEIIVWTLFYHLRNFGGFPSFLIILKSYLRVNRMIIYVNDLRVSGDFSRETDDFSQRFKLSKFSSRLSPRSFG